MKEKEYLGDAVYVQNDGFGLILTAENGIRATHTIYLEPSVYQKLVEYVQKCSQETIKRLDTTKQTEQTLPPESPFYPPS